MVVIFLCLFRSLFLGFGVLGICFSKIFTINNYIGLFFGMLFNFGLVFRFFAIFGINLIFCRFIALFGEHFII
jgi:hypothetical protein